MDKESRSIDSNFFDEHFWSSGSESDNPYNHSRRYRLKRTPNKRARRTTDDLRNKSLVSDIFKNISSLPTSTPNQRGLEKPSSHLNWFSAISTPRSGQSSSDYEGFKNVGNRSTNSSWANPNRQRSKQPNERTSESWGLSPSNESLGRLKSLVEGAMISSSDEELDFLSATGRARKKASPHPKLDSFQNRMANAIYDLDRSEDEADLPGSTDSIIEASTQPGSLHNAMLLLDYSESNSTQKGICDQTTLLPNLNAVPIPEFNIPDIADCDTDPPSLEDANVDPGSEDLIELFPITIADTSNHKFGPVKSELSQSTTFGQKAAEIVNLADSCSIVDLCDSSVEVTRSSEGPVEVPFEMPIEPLSRAGQSKTVKNSSPSKKRLMDVVLAECQTFSPFPLTKDPLDSFKDQYLGLGSEAKDAFDQLLIPSLDNDVRWMRCTDKPTAEQLVCNDLFMFLDDQEDFFFRLVIVLNASELTTLYSRLDPHAIFSTEAMRTHLLQDYAACTLPKCKNGFAQQAATTLFAKRFIKMRPKALFSAKMILDLLALPLTLYEKAVKHGDMARYFENLLAEVDSGRKRLLNLANLNCSSLIASEGEFRAFAESFALKINILFPKHQRPELPGMQSLSEVCAELAILLYGGTFQVNENPIFAFQVSNLVKALDEKVALLHTDDDEVLKAKFLCLDLLLQQNVTQFGLKGLWAKRKMTYLSKIFGIRCEAQQLKDVLSQNVSPLEQQIRAAFVAQIISSKRKGLTAAEKREIKTFLKDPHFKKTVLKIKWPTGDRKVNVIVSPYEEYYRKKYPNHVPNPGPLLMNAIYLAFWPVIYHQIDGVFFTNFQISPIDWGGVKFFERRKGFLLAQVAGFAEKGVDSLINTIEDHIRKYSGHHCIVDWPLIDGKMPEMRSLLKVLGLDKFLLIAQYVLQKASEREIGFPELAMWDYRMKLEFVGLKNPSDSLYYHQFVWLEKLTEFGIPAQECQVAWMR